MNLIFNRKVTAHLLSASLVTGISAYCVLSYLLIPLNFVLPICVILVFLTFGLTRYYSEKHQETEATKSDSGRLELSPSNWSKETREKNNNSISKMVFALIYSISIVLCASSNPRIDVVYMSWGLNDAITISQLISAVMLCFFMPGYAVIALVIKHDRINPILKILTGYLCSMLITSLTIYISSIYFESNIYENKTILISAYLAVLIVYVVYHKIYRLGLNNRNDISKLFRNFVLHLGNRIQTVIKVNLSELAVFASLFGLIIISTYYLYGGVTIGDQWYHQNRAIFFMYGNFKDLITTSGDQTYTPFLSSLLAGLTSVSGVPLVNGYVAIALLNMTSVLAFYCCCQTWFSSNTRRASLLATSLFVIASGFGWVYMLHLAYTDPIQSQANSLTYFVEEKIRVTDIRLSANFIIGAFPDFSTGLTLVCLPAGFILLSLLRVEFRNKIRYIIIILLISLSGILFHDEFYIFIIISLLLPLTFNLKNKAYAYYAIPISLAIIYLINSILPIEYFTFNRILGIPLIGISFLFTLATLSLYLSRQYWYRFSSFNPIKRLRSDKKITHHTLRISYISKIIIAYTVLYLFALCFLVWNQLPSNYVDVHTQNYNIPWYLYPMRLGVVGIIGIASILSFLFKKFEKEVYIFGIIILVSLIVGPYYSEHRLSKYVMAGVIGFASLLVFKLLSFITIKKPVLNGIILGSIVITASLSTLMYVGYNALVMETQDHAHALGRRNFPSPAEMEILDSLRSNIQTDSGQPNLNNVATFPSEYNFRNGDIISKLHAFSGLPIKDAIQTQYILNSSTLESFYRLLELSKTGYIMIPSNTINQDTLTDPTRFALDNFNQIYRNDNYTVLSVPSLRGPSINSENKVGIMYETDDPLTSSVLNKKKLDLNNRTYNFNYYYTLTSLALTGLEYDSYTDDDPSIFSNSIIILPFDSKGISDELFNRLLNYTKSGGKLIVINSDDKFEGRFSKFFLIESTDNKTEEFSRIASDKMQGFGLNVSGTLKNIEINQTSDSDMIASYRNADNRAVAPFALEKHTSGKGRIIYVNSFGYFDAVYTNPKKHLLSLETFTDMIGLDTVRFLNTKTTNEPIKRFIGDVLLNGNISIIGSSVSLINNLTGIPTLSIKNISVLDKIGNLRNQFENISIMDIKVLGRSEQIVNLRDEIKLPFTHSHHDYMGVPVPENFNMSIRLLDGNSSRVEIITNNSNLSSSIIISDNGSRVDLYGIRILSPGSRIDPILIKNPEIIIDGNVRFDKINFYGQEIDKYIPLDINGQVRAKFDFIEEIKEPYRNGVKINHLSYVDSISIDGEIDQLKRKIEIPGQIPYEVERRGLGVPIVSILISPINFIIIMIMATISALTILFRKRIFNSTQSTHK